MNETQNTPPPVPDNQPDEQPTTVLDSTSGAGPAPSAEPAATAPAPPDQPTQVLGTDPTRVEAPFSGGEYGQAASPAFAAAGGPSAGPAPQAAYPPGAFPPPGAFDQAAYPPPGSYSQGFYQPGPYAVPAGYAQQAPARRLTRSRNQRVIGGVCGGLARYWNTDPTLLRILTIVLTLATGGAFLIGYLIAWIAIPDEPMGPTGPYGTPSDQVGYAAGGNPAYATTPPEYIPPAPRERSYLGWLALSAAILAAGVLGLIGFLVPASVGIWGVILGISLAILGIGMLVGTRYGRARWLLWLAIPLTFITFATVTASNFVQSNPNWDRWTASTDADGRWGGLTIGDRTWLVTPSDAAESPLDFQLSAGAAVLDLTELTAVGDSVEEPRQRVEIDAGVGVGELIVLIPADMQLDLTGSVDIGQIDLPGSRPTEGDDLAVDTTITPLVEDQPAYIVTLDAALGAGNLEVRREAA
jgi:phage shock protein PspC (stress-responsive transcriptional regulator)